MNKCIFSLLACCLVISTTGCMTYPINNAEIPHRTTHLKGFELEPGKRVDIQAKNVWSDRWETIAIAFSREPHFWEPPILDPETGRQLYQWETWPVWIAPRFWDAWPYSNQVGCKIRALREDGRPIQTYNRPPDWSDSGALEDYGRNGNPEDFIYLRSR